MTTAEFAGLRGRAANLIEWLHLEMSKATLDLDRANEQAAKLLEALETMRIVDAALERQAIANALAVPVGGLKS